ncbi:MAG: hypothetical protein ABIA77_03635, partial [Candidatus Omnitrophota bacterium]
LEKALIVIEEASVPDESILDLKEEIEGILAGLKGLPDRVEREKMPVEKKKGWKQPVAAGKKEKLTGKSKEDKHLKSVVRKAFISGETAVKLSKKKQVSNQDRDKILWRIDEIRRMTDEDMSRGNLIKLRKGLWMSGAGKFNIVFTVTAGGDVLVLSAGYKKEMKHKKILGLFPEGFDDGTIIKNAVDVDEFRKTGVSGITGISMKAPGSLPMDEDGRVDTAYINGLISKATEWPGGRNIPEAADHINRHAPPFGNAEVDPSKVRIYAVDEPAGKPGLPRFENAEKPADLIYALGRYDKEEGVVKIYVTKKYLETYLENDVIALAELIDHEYTENVLGYSHRAAASRARMFVPEGAFLSPFHYFYLNLVITGDDYSLARPLVADRTASDDVEKAYGGETGAIGKTGSYEKLFFSYLRLLEWIRKADREKDHDISAEYALRIYKILEKSPEITLTREQGEIYRRIYRERFYAHEFEKAEKVYMPLSKFSLADLEDHGEDVIFTGSKLGAGGELYSKGRKRPVVRVTGYAGANIAFSFRNGDLYRIWILDAENNAIDLRQMGQIYETNGSFRKRFYFKLTKPQFDGLGDCVIRDHRLDAGGALHIGGRVVNFGDYYAMCKTEIHVMSGQIESVVIFDEKGKPVQKAEFVLIYNEEGLLKGSFYRNITRREFSKLNNVVLRRVRLNSGGLSIGGVAGPVLYFYDYPDGRAVVDIEVVVYVKNGEIAKVTDTKGRELRKAYYDEKTPGKAVRVSNMPDDPKKIRDLLKSPMTVDEVLELSGSGYMREDLYNGNNGILDRMAAETRPDRFVYKDVRETEEGCESVFQVIEGLRDEKDVVRLKRQAAKKLLSYYNSHLKHTKIQGKGRKKFDEFRIPNLKYPEKEIILRNDSSWHEHLYFKIYQGSPDPSPGTAYAKVIDKKNVLQVFDFFLYPRTPYGQGLGNSIMYFLCKTASEKGLLLEFESTVNSATVHLLCKYIKNIEGYYYSPDENRDISIKGLTEEEMIRLVQEGEMLRDIRGVPKTDEEIIEYMAAGDVDLEKEEGPEGWYCEKSPPGKENFFLDFNEDEVISVFPEKNGMTGEGEKVAVVRVTPENLEKIRGCYEKKDDNTDLPRKDREDEYRREKAYYYFKLRDIVNGGYADELSAGTTDILAAISEKGVMEGFLIMEHNGPRDVRSGSEKIYSDSDTFFNITGQYAPWNSSKGSAGEVKAPSGHDVKFKDIDGDLAMAAIDHAFKVRGNTLLYKHLAILSGNAADGMKRVEEMAGYNAPEYGDVTVNGEPSSDLFIPVRSALKWKIRRLLEFYAEGPMTAEDILKLSGLDRYGYIPGDLYNGNDGLLDEMAAETRPEYFVHKDIVETGEGCSTVFRVIEGLQDKKDIVKVRRQAAKNLLSYYNRHLKRGKSLGKFDEFRMPNLKVPEKEITLVDKSPSDAGFYFPVYQDSVAGGGYVEATVKESVLEISQLQPYEGRKYLQGIGNSVMYLLSKLAAERELPLGIDVTTNPAAVHLLYKYTKDIDGYYFSGRTRKSIAGMTEEAVLELIKGEGTIVRILYHIRGTPKTDEEIIEYMAIKGIDLRIEEDRKTGDETWTAREEARRELSYFNDNLKVEIDGDRIEQVDMPNLSNREERVILVNGSRAGNDLLFGVHMGSIYDRREGKVYATEKDGVLEIWDLHPYRTGKYKQGRGSTIMYYLSKLASEKGVSIGFDVITDEWVARLLYKYATDIQGTCEYGDKTTGIAGMTEEEVRGLLRKGVVIKDIRGIPKSDEKIIDYIASRSDPAVRASTGKQSEALHADIHPGTKTGIGRFVEERITGEVFPVTIEKVSKDKTAEIFDDWFTGKKERDFSVREWMTGRTRRGFLIRVVYNGETIALLSVREHSKNILISRVEVDKEWRRRGVFTQMILALPDIFPLKEIRGYFESEGSREAILKMLNEVSEKGRFVTSPDLTIGKAEVGELADKNKVYQDKLRAKYETYNDSQDQGNTLYETPLSLLSSKTDPDTLFSDLGGVIVKGNKFFIKMILYSAWRRVSKKNVTGKAVEFFRMLYILTKGFGVSYYLKGDITPVYEVLEGLEQGDLNEAIKKASGDIEINEKFREAIDLVRKTRGISREEPLDMVVFSSNLRGAVSFCLGIDAVKSELDKLNINIKAVVSNRPKEKEGVFTGKVDNPRVTCSAKWDYIPEKCLVLCDKADNGYSSSGHQVIDVNNAENYMGRKKEKGLEAPETVEKKDGVDTGNVTEKAGEDPMVEERETENAGPADETGDIRFIRDEKTGDIFSVSIEKVSGTDAVKVLDEWLEEERELESFWRMIRLRGMDGRYPSGEEFLIRAVVNGKLIALLSVLLEKDETVYISFLETDNAYPKKDILRNLFLFIHGNFPLSAVRGNFPDIEDREAVLSILEDVAETARSEEDKNIMIRGSELQKLSDLDEENRVDARDAREKFDKTVWDRGRILENAGYVIPWLVQAMIDVSENVPAGEKKEKVVLLLDEDLSGISGKEIGAEIKRLIHVFADVKTGNESLKVFLENLEVVKGKGEKLLNKKGNVKPENIIVVTKSS